MTTADASAFLTETISHTRTPGPHTVQIRVKEEFAAFLHDTVLQTLALIQSHSDAPKEVKLMASHQDAELRAWLGSVSTVGEGDLAAALTNVAMEVGRRFQVFVDIVASDGCRRTPSLDPLVFATREAIINAAKHSGVDQIDVFATADDAEVSVWVRDRGIGFDQETVGADRWGVSKSIRRRIQAAGGEVTIRTAPGEGTEVLLTVPRGRS